MDTKLTQLTLDDFSGMPEPKRKTQQLICRFVAMGFYLCPSCTDVCDKLPGNACYLRILIKDRYMVSSNERSEAGSGNGLLAWTNVNARVRVTISDDPKLQTMAARVSTLITTTLRRNEKTDMANVHHSLVSA